MNTEEIINKWKNNEPLYLDLDELYVVAEHIGADTSLAKRLRGRGFQSKTLIESIDKKLKEDSDTASYS